MLKRLSDRQELGELVITTLNTYVNVGIYSGDTPWWWGVLMGRHPVWVVCGFSSLFLWGGSGTVKRKRQDSSRRVVFHWTTRIFKQPHFLCHMLYCYILYILCYILCTVIYDTLNSGGFTVSYFKTSRERCPLPSIPWTSRLSKIMYILVNTHISIYTDIIG